MRLADMRFMLLGVCVSSCRPRVKDVWQEETGGYSYGGNGMAMLNAYLDTVHRRHRYAITASKCGQFC